MPFDKAVSKATMRWSLQESTFNVYDHVTQGGTSSQFILKLWLESLSLYIIVSSIIQVLFWYISHIFFTYENMSFVDKKCD